MDTVQIIGTSTQELLSHLKITAKVAVTEITEDETQLYTVEISGNDLGILIGYHGETLNQFQQILSLIVNNKLPEWTKIIVDINGWREERKETIENMARQAITRVKGTGQSQHLPTLSAYERRIVHSLVSEDSEVSSHSEGEGPNRKLIISLKQN
jgi:spoIIIJ-associated protein